MFHSVIPSVTGTLTIQTAAICTLVSIVLGLIVAASYMLQGRYTKNYVVTLAVLPVMVQVVIMLVNGNLGTGIAVMGAFSLVRFRSVPGSSREIGGVFLAMVVGLAAGMGYLSYAAMVVVAICLIQVVLYRSNFGTPKGREHWLKITIPENLDYSQIFDDIFQEYTESCQLLRVKTVNMGSMYELTYEVKLKQEEQAKQMIDAIRTRNGNLTIIFGRPLDQRGEEL